MAGSLDIGALSGRIELEDHFSSGLKLAGQAVNEFDEKFGGLGAHMAATTAAFFTAEAAIDAVKEGITLAIETLKDMTVEGAKIADVEHNFDHLTESAGRLGSTLINELKAGTHNTITDFELMKMAGGDLAAGMNLTDKQFRTMAEGAFAIAQAKAISVKEALEVMNDAMLTGRTRAIALTFGKIDLAAAEDKYATAAGKTADHLTAEGKIEAAREAILTRVGEATARLGVQMDGMDEKVDQAHVTWANFYEDLSKTVATSPVLLAGFDAIRDELTAAFGGHSEDLIQAISHAINEAAIDVLEFAKTASDGVGIVISVWNSAGIVFVNIKEGITAITYVTEELLLGLMKIANFATGGLAFNDWIKATEKDLDRLYSNMAEGMNDIAKFQKSSDDWAVSTGHFNEAIDRITARMKAAGEGAKDAAGPTKELAETQKAAAQAAAEHNAEEQKAAMFLKQTAEEAKKMAAAMEEIHSAGTSVKDTLAKMDPIIVAQVETYLKAGVSQTALATAYSLTAAQVKAVSENLKDEAESFKIEQKQIDDSTKRWADYHAMKIEMSGTETSKTIADIDRWEAAQIKSHEQAKTDTADFYEWLTKTESLMMQKADQARLEQDVHSKAHWDAVARDAKDAYDFASAHADQFTSEYINDLKQTSDAAAQAAASWKSNMGGALDDTIGKIRTLSGEWMTVADFAKKQTQGFTVDSGVTDQFKIDTTKGGADALLDRLFYLSQHLNDPVTDWQSQNLHFSQLAEFNSLRAAYQLLTSQAKKPHKPIPGMAEGGIGEFGSGTLVALHGREAIIPLNSPGAMGAMGSVNVTNYINGTAAEVARQVSAELMRSLKQVRQYGAA